ncbi:MAG TPA: hypothetical protein VKC15_15120 [Gemmatimonadales bacterium]|nr:hypothetical protein [Gemmatimonadales bacterium]
MPMPMSGGVLGIPDSRAGSGTAWLPDSSPMHAAHFSAGRWSLMVHGIVAPLYDYQRGPRGNDQVNVINWGMLTARRQMAGGSLALRAMLSADPWTVGPRGYPLLLQSGESYRGAPLVDRQHPHDLWIELAALWERPLAANLAASLYLAAVGEPAVGPPAFQHRPSAQSDPFAPLGHHWQDATHTTYGALTAGLFSRAVKVEASAFNGREPDAQRTDFDFRHIDSYSVRVAANPGARWSLSVWYAYLESPEELHADEAIHRYGAALLTSQGRLNAAFVWGANAELGGTTSHSLLAEGDVEVLRGHHMFTRVEYVRKSGEDLAVLPGPYDIGSIVFGYVKDWGPFSAGLRGAFGIIPVPLKATYGSRTPFGAAVYGRWRPR